MGRFLIEIKEYLGELGRFALRLRLLLRIWVEEPVSWMRGDLHVPNRTSIRESIDGILGGKMRLRGFKWKLEQFEGFFIVGGKKGFRLYWLLGMGWAKGYWAFLFGWARRAGKRKKWAFGVGPKIVNGNA
ncbi:Hypothetical predicted protein [Olea europaea subsp. europaea]|uniref:Uncharacterized protein n=1 Tax=Olea europaea subsp. europaea TaxID=158383 RepID=A0A8S0SCU8_OLEEU|nr:Hypothetical predicted protein [Olea europaea subsp. europaea]